MKHILYILISFFLLSCTSNTIYEKPKDLIPKDTMILLLQDMYIANSAKSYRNVNKERNIDYTSLVYDKYKIDSTRFKSSNIYYTSKINEYEEILKQVRSNIDTLLKEKKEMEIKPELKSLEQSENQE